MSREKDVPEKIHAELGASKASQWMNCAGSIALSRGIPDRPSGPHAQEGTRAHSLAELCLKKGVEPDIYVGMTLENGVVDEDMAENTKVYIDHARELFSDATEHWIEHKFTLASLNPVEPIYGTADAVAYHEPTRRLTVCDLKFGRGVVVEVKGNVQLRIYALGALLELGAGRDIDDVEITIVQPRAGHPDGPIRSEVISVVELTEFAATLLEAARATTIPGAPLNAGSHCRWCKAAGVCPEQQKASLALAQIDFAVDVPAIPLPPELLAPAEIARVLTIADQIETWLTAVKARGQEILATGGELPGYKLVERVGHRKWASESDTEQWLKAKGLETDEITTSKLKSPAQIEKLIGKKNLPAERTIKPSAGVVMVPASDKRPAVASLASVEFAQLEAGDE